MRGPGDYPPVTGEQVGEMVRQAIVDDQFLLLTHPEIQDVLVRRAQDPEGFLAGQIAKVVDPG